MNDEIKEILSLLNSSSWSNEAEKIEDYITNLQQDNTMYAQLKDEYEEEIKELQQENERLRENNSNMQEEMARVWEENERLKEQINQYENPNDMTLFYMWLDTKAKDKMKQLENEVMMLKQQNTMITTLGEDYKSRCEKASECIKKDTRWFDSEYASIYGELCDCAGAKGDRLEVMVNPSNALNILQNGSDSQ